MTAGAWAVYTVHARLYAQSPVHKVVHGVVHCSTRYMDNSFVNLMNHSLIDNNEMKCYN